MMLGLLLTILKSSNALYFRILNLFHIGFINKNDKEGTGAKVILGIHRLQFDFSITMRNYDYVEYRIKNEEGPTASA